VVQKTLGHKSAVVTLDRYGHPWPNELEDLADRLDAAHAQDEERTRRSWGFTALHSASFGLLPK
jgi:hypothetical protein